MLITILYVTKVYQYSNFKDVINYSLVEINNRFGLGWFSSIFMDCFFKPRLKTR